MMTALFVLTALLTAGFVFQTVVLLVLARQIGILHERLAPIGAQPTLPGLQQGQALPAITARRLDGNAFPLGGMAATGRPLLLMAVGPDCPICKRVIPLAAEAVRARGMDFVLLGDGDAAAWHEMSAVIPPDVPLVTSHELLLLLQVDRLPTLVVLDPRGVIVARGLANSRGQVAALLDRTAPPAVPVPQPAEQETHHAVV